MPDDDLFGLTKEQRYYIDVAAQQAAEKAIAEAEGVLESVSADLRAAVYGNGSDGLKTDVTRLKEQVGQLVWQSRTTLAAAIVAVLGAVISLIVSG